MTDRILASMMARIDAVDWRPRRTLAAQGIMFELARNSIDTAQARDRLIAAGWNREQADRIISNELRKHYED